MSHKRQQYSRDLTDEQWEILQPLLPLEQTGPGRPLERAMRDVINVIFYIVRTGTQWENLPPEFANSNSVYYPYRKWCSNGTWQRINTRLRQYEPHPRGRTTEPSAAIIDSQSVKTTQMGGPRGFDGGKQGKGRKHHIVVDTVGNLLEGVVHAANIHDSLGAKPLLHKLAECTQRALHKIWADQAYSGSLIEWVHEQFNAVLQIVHKEPDQKGFQVLPKRWIVERSLAWLHRFRRLRKDYEHTLASSEGVVYIASIRTMLKRLAA